MKGTASGKVEDNGPRSRFELEVDGDVVFADYRRDGSTLIITWVEAPPRLRGTGAADRLMRGIVEIARNRAWGIQATCGYAAGWLRLHNRRARWPMPAPAEGSSPH